MAVKITAGADMRRTDAFAVNPHDIIIKEEHRGRYMPPSEAAIIAMAVSMLEIGQRQPVECRRDADSNLLLTSGFTRTAAARLIRDGFTDADGNKRQDTAYLIQTTVRDGNDDEAFKRNVVENAIRNATSPIDDAHNQDRLRTHYAMTDGEIAKLYQYCDQSKVSRLRRLLMHPKEVQQLVHVGDMSVQAALDLLDLPDDQRKTAVAAAVKDGKINGALIRKQVRDHHLRDSDDKTKGTSDAAPAAKTKTKARTIKELRTFFEGLSAPVKDDTDTRTPKMIELAQAMRWFISGARSEKFLTETLERLTKR